MKNTIIYQKALKFLFCILILKHTLTSFWYFENLEIPFNLTILLLLI